MARLRRWYRNQADLAVAEGMRGLSGFVACHSLVVALLVTYPTMLVVAVIHPDRRIVEGTFAVCMLIGAALGHVSWAIAWQRRRRYRRFPTTPKGRPKAGSDA